jgi:probable HAF family extracellular repeat protein
MRGTTQMMGRALVGALVLAFIATAGWSQSLTWLGTLPDGGRSEAYGVSADGVVVGRVFNAAGQDRAFRWTAAGGMRNLGTLGGRESWANGVSADGSVVVGRAYNAAGQRRAFRWTASGGMRNLGTLGGDESEAYGVSADGAVVVGGSYNAAGYGNAFRWTASGGMQNLGTLGGDASWALGVSADGAVVVGLADNAAGQWRAFRWTASGGMQNLGTLGGDESAAWGVSADGAVVVGWAENAAGQWRAFRWTASGGMQNLGTLGGGRSWALGVSADGAVVVGWAENAAEQRRAFRWTAAGGMEDLNTTYANLLTPGSYLERATAISPDGRYIVGLATTPPQGASKPSCWIQASRGAGGCEPQRLCGRRRSVALAIRVWREWLPQRRPQLGRHSRRRRFAAGAVPLRQWVLVCVLFAPLLQVPPTA